MPHGYWDMGLCHILCSEDRGLYLRKAQVFQGQTQVTKSSAAADADFVSATKSWFCQLLARGVVKTVDTIEIYPDLTRWLVQLLGIIQSALITQPQLCHRKINVKERRIKDL
jgi:hypothetical protein